MEEELSLEIPEEPEQAQLPQAKPKKTPTFYEEGDHYGAFDSGSPFASPPPADLAKS